MSITSLFINKSERLEHNEWLEAKPFPTKGYKFRPHWHFGRNKALGKDFALEHFQPELALCTGFR